VMRINSNTATMILIIWGVIIAGAFALHPFLSNDIFASRDNPILLRLPKGSILDRYGVPLATGEPREYPLGAAGEPLVWAYLERRLSEQLTSKKSSKILYLFGGDGSCDVKTTIDSDLQRASVAAIKDCTGALVILKINGEILSFASSPGFSPNGLTKERFDQIKEDKRALLSNRCETLYSPGSSFKILIAEKLIAKGLPEKPYYCRGHVKVGQKIIRCKTAHGLVDLKSATRLSCNGYFISRAISDLSEDDLVSAYNQFSSRQIKELPNKIDKAFFAIGQGNQNVLSPSELAVISATIARNDGLKPVPVFLKKDISLTKAMDPKVTKQLAGLMTDVVDQGTARGLRSSKYRIIAAKTDLLKWRPRRG